MFDREEEVLRVAKGMMSRENLTKEELREAFEDLVREYDYLLRDVKIITRTSDRSKNKMSKRGDN